MIASVILIIKTSIAQVGLQLDKCHICMCAANYVCVLFVSLSHAASAACEQP